MSQHRASALRYAEEHNQRFQDELQAFVSIPSVSTDPAYNPDIQRAADWVAGQLQSLGLSQVKIFPTGGHPVVYGELKASAAGAPTVLVYGHYDVQPPDPLDLWDSGPFNPVVTGDLLFGRGASDMKGQVMATLKAIEAILQTGSSPVNVKFLIEGEEEIGSQNLEAFIASHLDLLACDLALNPDTGMLDDNLPTITYGLRGLAYFELRVFGPEHDLHSGLYGGVVHNPAQALCELITGMHDAQGRVTLPGFYDRVALLDQEERAELARLPTNEEFFKKQTGAPALWGEADFSPTERIGARPTLEINGLLSGFTGQGTKTVLPAWAMAKISCRLVADQDPEEVYLQLQEYLKAHAPGSIRYEVKELTVGIRASISDCNSQGVKSMERAMEAVWGKRPLFRREGGSVPVVVLFKELVGVESVNCGFSLPSDHVHAPNERLHLPTWRRGIDTLIHFFFNLHE